MAKPKYVDVHTTCQACGARLKVRKGRTGLVYKCPKCNEVLDFDAPTSAPFAEQPSVPTARVRLNNPDPSDPGYQVSADTERPLADPAAKPDHIPVVCPLCHTRLYAKPHQINQTLTCPDCRRSIVVRPPPEASPRPARATLDGADEYKVREGVDQPPLGSAAHSKYFSLTCPTCHTRLSATEDQIGTELTCPDCRRPVPVKRPSPPAPKRQWLEDDGVEIAIQPTFERPMTVVPLRDRDVVEAEVKVKRTVSEAPELPHFPLAIGVFNFPIYRNVWPYLLGYGAWLAGLLLLIHYIIWVMINYPAAMIAVIFLLKLTAVGFGFWWFTTASVYLAIIQDSSEGLDRVENWPESVLLASEIRDPFFMLNSAALALAAGGMLMTLLRSIPELAVVFGLCSTVAFFPLFLLSMLANDSPMAPFSRPVWSGVARSLGSWAVFYFQTTAVAGGTLWIGVLAWREGAFWAIAGLGYVIFAALLVYFRMLGRLAWITALADDAADDDSEHEDAAQLEEVLPA